MKFLSNVFTKRRLKIAKWILGGLASAAALTLTINYYSQTGNNNNMIVGNNNNVCSANIDTNNYFLKEDTFASTDSVGRQILFYVALLSAEKRWEKGEYMFTEGHQNFDSTFAQILHWSKQLQSCKELIAIGLASQEGDSMAQYELAGRRADEVLMRLRGIDNVKNLYKLNMGKHKFVNAKLQTSEQRRIIIGGIMKRDVNMKIEDIRYALRKSLYDSMKAKLDLELNNYCNFTFTHPQ